MSHPLPGRYKAGGGRVRQNTRSGRQRFLLRTSKSGLGGQVRHNTDYAMPFRKLNTIPPSHSGSCFES